MGLSYDEQLHNARLLRETKGTTASLNELDSIERKAHLDKEYQYAAKAKAEALVDYQHQFERGDLSSLDTMHKLALQGLDYIKSHPAAQPEEKTFHYRLGVICFLKKEWADASEHFETALSLITENDPEYPEFASYYGAASVIFGNDDGRAYLYKAERQLAVLKSTEAFKNEPWRYLVTMCGIQMRFALIAWYTRDYSLYRVSMDAAERMAESLDSGYHMGHRKVQLAAIRQDTVHL